MRKAGSWMTVWDDRILEYIHIHGSGYATEIAETNYIHVTQQHISRRLHKLAEHDLLEQINKGVYQVTEQGRCYLTGEYDAERAEYIENVDTYSSILGAIDIEQL